jgi:type I restriction enzyme, S subunit
MSFPKYEVYKDSGVEWLGEVPNHWKILALKRRFRIEGGSTPSPNEENWDGDITWVTPADLSNLNSLYVSSSKRSITPIGLASCSSVMLPVESIVLSTRAPIGSLAVAKSPLCTNQGCKGLIPFDEAFSNYFAYVLLIAKSELNNRGKGTTFLELSSDELARFDVPSPTVIEQNQIACFLDRETTRIDALIAEQQRLIELLKEKRQVVISHAVTKGIDRTVPMKDSGVEWLGEVPEHWEICQSKHLFDSVTSGSRGWAEYYSDDGYLFFRIANLTRDTIDPKLDSKQFVNPPVGSEGERSKIRVCDILISITADLGSVCVANLDIAGGYVSQHVALVRPNEKKVFSRWLAYFVLSSVCKEQLLGAGYGGTKIQLSLEDIKSFIVAAPPYEEQILIATFLDSEISKFESLINEAVLGIALLTERRSALISAAVTGKIDVRNWQPSPEPTATHGRQ